MANKRERCDDEDAELLLLGPIPISDARDPDRPRSPTPPPHLEGGGEPVKRPKVIHMTLEEVCEVLEGRLKDCHTGIMNNETDKYRERGEILLTIGRLMRENNEKGAMMALLTPLIEMTLRHRSIEEEYLHHYYNI
jgi:hypothetical protein